MGTVFLIEHADWLIFLEKRLDLDEFNKKAFDIDIDIYLKSKWWKDTLIIR